MPRAMAYTWWNWPSYLAADQLAVTVTLHNDPDPMQNGGLYLIACTGFAIGNQGAYFGIQTNMHHRKDGWRGKGAIFSRWYNEPLPHTDRLADTRLPDHGWTGVGDNEGSFTSVRGEYPWEAGTYTMELRGADTDSGGRWFEYWLTDGEGVETWIGSLRFPFGPTNEALMWPSCGTTIEAYGGRTRTASEIPYWKVTQERPVMEGEPAIVNTTCYPKDVETLRNARVVYSEATGTTVYEVGLDYMAHSLAPGTIC